jgi:Flp pilus assembly protein TadG
MKPFNRRVGWRLHSASRSLKAKILYRERGTTAVEFAICAVLLLTLIFGIMDFSRCLYAYHFLSKSAREATRYAIVRGSACTSWGDGCCPIPLNDQDCVQNYVRSLAAPSAGLIDPNAITVTTAWPTDNKRGSQVQVQLNYTFQFILPFLPSSVYTLHSTSEMVIAQ